MPALPSKPPYQLTFDTELVDFGKVTHGEKREHTFKFVNSGSKPVEIDLITSCECTSLDWLEGKVYGPGESGTIHAIFDSTEKEKSETVDIDIILKNDDPKTGYPILYTVKYRFELVE